MTPEQLETIADVARETIEKTTHEIEISNNFIDGPLVRWLENTKKLAETMLWLCDELRDARGW